MAPDSAPVPAAPSSLDAYAPPEIARRVAQAAVAKTAQPWLATVVLGLLGGGFIALGGIGLLLVASDASLSFATSRVLGGLVFSLGLILVVVAGAELFTGNNLFAMAWADGLITTGSMLRHWAIVLAANAAGAGLAAALVALSGFLDMNGGAVGEAAVRTAAHKSRLPFAEAFFAGVLCNLLVCLAVWLAMAGHTVVDKVVAIIFPIAAFVAAGFEHSVANMFFLPLGIWAGGLDPAGYAHNLVPVILGNVAGGSGLVALVYFAVYRLAPRLTTSRTDRPDVQPRAAPRRGHGGR